MHRDEKLFRLSLPEDGRYRKILSLRPDYEDLVTFAENKTTPVYNWFYYKEGFSRDLVWKLIEELGIPKGSRILDPFCGTGTTLLAAKQLGYDAVGFDILPLGVFVSNTKLADGYDIGLLQEEMRRLSSVKFGPAKTRWADPGFLDMRKAFSSYARNDLLFFRDRIMEVSDEKTRNFLLLGLVSIVSEASNTKKDGGVIRIVRKRHLAPVRFLLRNRLRRMLKDAKRMAPSRARAEAFVGDARSLSLEEGSIDACITSPPYLNYVDYTKVYGLELSLLLSSAEEMRRLRTVSLRSHVGAEYRKGGFGSEKLAETLEAIRENAAVNARYPEVLSGYFEDLFLHMRCLHPILRDGGTASYVVGNTCLPGMTIDTDLILAELGEKLGYEAKQIMVAKARWCDVAGIRKERPVRESIVVLEK